MVGKDCREEDNNFKEKPIKDIIQVEIQRNQKTDVNDSSKKQITPDIDHSKVTLTLYDSLQTPQLTSKVPGFVSQAEVKTTNLYPIA